MATKLQTLKFEWSQGFSNSCQIATSLLGKEGLETIFLLFFRQIRLFFVFFTQFFQCCCWGLTEKMDNFYSNKSNFFLSNRNFKWCCCEIDGKILDQIVIEKHCDLTKKQLEIWFFKKILRRLFFSADSFENINPCLVEINSIKITSVLFHGLTCQSRG